MKRLVAFAFVVLACHPARAASGELKAAYGMASKDGSCYGGELLETLCKAFHDSRDPDQFLAMIQQRLHVTRDSADVIGSIGIPMITDGFFDLEAGDREAYVATLNAALRKESNRAPLFGLMAAFIAFDREHASARYREMLPLIRDDNAALVTAAEAGKGAAVPIFLGAAFANDPDDAKVIAAIGALGSAGVVRAAFGPLRVTGDGATLRGAPDAEALREQLTAMAEAGSARALLAAFDAIPANVQKQVLTSGDGRELALDLAAAAVLEQKPDIAARFFRKHSGNGVDSEASFRRIVAGVLPDAHEDDAFAVLEDSLGTFGPYGGLRSDLLALYAERNGYAAFAAELRDDARLSREAELNAENIAESWRAVIAPFMQAPSPVAAAAATRTAPSSLATARIVPFTEHHLDEIQPTASVVQVIDCSDTERVARTTHLPPWVSPIRMERNGDDVVAIVISAALDPVGEIGLGAYWVLRSTDGGNTWSRYYTGLRQNMPYVVPPASTLPLLDGDRLRLEVEVQELDTSSITFPPIGMRLARSEKGLYLDMPLADLTRDSDGDGLTDLYEERITTDAHEIDTDGDGIADGEDLLPRVARVTGERTAAAEILAAVLEGFRLGKGRLVVGIGADLGAAETAQQSCEVRTSDVGDPVLFLVGDPSQFAGLTLARRTVVLTRDEDMQYGGKFGITFAARIQYFLIDKNGERAILQLNESWTGATFLCKKTKQGWEVTPVNQWIT